VKPQFIVTMAWESCGAAMSFRQAAIPPSLLRSFTFKFTVSLGLASRATVLSCFAANHIDYQSADVTPITNEALLTPY